MPLHGTTSISYDHFCRQGSCFKSVQLLRWSKLWETAQSSWSDNTLLGKTLYRSLYVYTSVSPWPIHRIHYYNIYIYILYYIYCTYTISVYYIIICTIQTRSAIFVNLACIVTLSGSALCTIQLHRSTVRFKQRTAVPNCLPLKCEHPGKSRSTVSALLFNQAIDKPCCQTENCQRLKEHWNHQGFQR